MTPAPLGEREAPKYWRPWARWVYRIHPRILQVVVFCTLPLFLLLGAAMGMSEAWDDWRKQRRLP